MNVLINCSNQHKGGAIQVINSICIQLNRFTQHYFIVVLSDEQRKLGNEIDQFPNVTSVIYSMKDSLFSILSGRNTFLDNLVKQYHIDIVFTVFGIARWRPKCLHFCGFARAQLLFPNSPYIKNITLIEKIKFKIQMALFRRDAYYYYTENPIVSTKLLPLLRKEAKVYTVTNYYNQIYDMPEHWIRNIQLPDFEGVTILTIGIPYPHKNFEIIPRVARVLQEKYASLNFRFVVTALRTDFEKIPDDIADKIIFLGPISFESCPYLYSQSNIMFMPSLLECFSATFPEAMKMKVPIVTVDLDYAHGLCEKAACYYKATDETDAARLIYKVATNHNYATNLINHGTMQLARFDDYKMRAEKLISIMEHIYEENS